MVLYGGVPINEVDFEKEFDKELEQLKQTIEMLEQRKQANDIAHNYWTLKLHNANKALDQGTVSLD